MAYNLVQKDLCLFHLTHLKNFPSILKNGILAHNEVTCRGLAHESVAHDNIQERRKNIKITCGAKGFLHDYVPLYFGARSPMLCAVRYKVDQREIIHIAVDWAVLKLNTTVFTDGNAATAGTSQFSGIENLHYIDLDAAALWYWAGDEESRRKKSAEVLVHKSVGLEQIMIFFVMNKQTGDTVRKMLDSQNVERDVIVASEFYY